MSQIELSNPEEWVDRYGDALFRFALLRVRDQEVAQDLVQETFVAALGSRHRFAGRSAEKTWLLGILKHKIFDHFRQRGREDVADESRLIEEASEEEATFDRDGHWRSHLVGPRKWPGDPSVLLEQKEFWNLLKQALSELPPRMATAFVLREVDGLETKEICDVLHVSPANLWVMLHRARKHLRNRLEDRVPEVGLEADKSRVAEVPLA